MMDISESEEWSDWTDEFQFNSEDELMEESNKNESSLSKQDIQTEKENESEKVSNDKSSVNTIWDSVLNHDIQPELKSNEGSVLEQDNQPEELISSEDSFLELKMQSERLDNGASCVLEQGNQQEELNNDGNIDLEQDKEPNNLNNAEGSVLEQDNQLELNNAEGSVLGQDNQLELNNAEGSVLEQDNQLELNNAEGSVLDQDNQLELNNAEDSVLGQDNQQNSDEDNQPEELSNETNGVFLEPNNQPNKLNSVEGKLLEQNNQPDKLNSDEGSLLGQDNQPKTLKNAEDCVLEQDNQPEENNKDEGSVSEQDHQQEFNNDEGIVQMHDNPTEKLTNNESSVLKHYNQTEELNNSESSVLQQANQPEELVSSEGSILEQGNQPEELSNGKDSVLQQGNQPEELANSEGSVLEQGNQPEELANSEGSVLEQGNQPEVNNQEGSVSEQVNQPEEPSKNAGSVLEQDNQTELYNDQYSVLEHENLQEEQNKEIIVVEQDVQPREDNENMTSISEDVVMAKEINSKKKKRKQVGKSFNAKKKKTHSVTREHDKGTEKINYKSGKKEEMDYEGQEENDSAFGGNEGSTKNIVSEEHGKSYKDILEDEDISIAELKRRMAQNDLKDSKPSPSYDITVDDLPLAELKRRSVSTKMENIQTSSDDNVTKIEQMPLESINPLPTADAVHNLQNTDFDSQEYFVNQPTKMPEQNESCMYFDREIYLDGNTYQILDIQPDFNMDTTGDNTTLYFVPNTDELTLEVCADDEALDESNVSQGDIGNIEDLSDVDLKQNELRTPIKRKRIPNTRDENWKKRGKNIKRKINKVNRSSIKDDRAIQNENTSTNQVYEGDTEASDTTKAIELSIREKKAFDIVHKYHNGRLEKLLASNLMERKKVYPDGNCLFVSVLEQVGNIMTVADLRKKVAEHLEENLIHYLCFANFSETLTPEEEHGRFVELIQDVRKDGEWNSDMSDFVPLCIANIFGRNIRVFSSDPHMPVFDIEPDLVLPRGDQIYLAYMAIHDNGHYDPVQIKQSKSKENDSTSSIARNERESTDEHFQSPKKRSPRKDAKTNSNPELTPQRKQHFQSPKKRSSRKNAKPSSDPELTPHKDVKYQSPKRRQLSRRKKLQKENWKQNVRKEKRAKGEAYTNVCGKCVPAKKLKKVNCSKCRNKGTDKITEEEREKIFMTYWGLGDYIKQRNFICQHVEEEQPKRRQTERQRTRTVSNSYFLTTEKTKTRVCKKFFMSTLDIGKKTIMYAMKKKSHGIYTGKDMRGSKEPGNKTPEADMKFVHDHIESFATLDPHYTRKDTKRKYLASELNIKQMYRLYVEKCKEVGKKCVSQPLYRKVFCEDYNLSFFRPKKDLCSVCSRYEHLKSEGKLTETDKQEYNAHQDRKTKARSEKERDKERAKTDKTFHVSTVDLQAVLTCPCCLVGELYYKRKLNCYNLSFYSLGNADVKCYLWDETHGRRGSCEIGTCILTYLKSLNSSISKIKEVTLYSDTCGAQNRNQFVTAVLLYSMQELQNLTCINQKFLESGHSEMECDSVHASIENIKKKTKIYQPSQWELIVTMARRGKPYVVIPMKFKDFKDLKQLNKDMIRNMKIDKAGNKINWLKIKWIQIRKEVSSSIFVNYSFDETRFQEVVFTASAKRGRPSNPTPAVLKQRYTAKLPISVKKKKDLLALCTSGTIPEEHHAYYSGLVSNKKSP